MIVDILMKTTFLPLLLLLCGDVESNPGPTGRRSVAQGPTIEEQASAAFEENIFLFYQHSGLHSEHSDDGGAEYY